MNKEELLLLAANQFEQAKKIESRVNWNNDAERDSALNKSSRLLFEAMWNFTAATYRKEL